MNGSNVGLIAPGFRNSAKTTEFYGTLLAIILGLVLCRGCGPLVVGILVVCAIGSFNISRALYKKNRALFMSCFYSVEWWMTVSGHFFIAALSLFGGLDGWKAASLIVASQGIYNIGRGVSKGVGVKTQTIMR